MQGPIKSGSLKATVITPIFTTSSMDRRSGVKEANRRAGRSTSSRMVSRSCVRPTVCVARRSQLGHREARGREVGYVPDSACLLDDQAGNAEGATHNRPWTNRASDDGRSTGTVRAHREPHSGLLSWFDTTSSDVRSVFWTCRSRSSVV